MNDFYPTRCFIDGKQVSVRVRKQRGDNRTKVIERLIVKTPFAADYVAIRFNVVWLIVDIRRLVKSADGSSMLRVPIQIVKQDLPEDAVVMWLMYKGSS